jgi:hypothetical protein
VSGGSQASEVRAHTRFVILPDRGNSIAVGIFGAALLFAGLYFDLKWLSVLMIVLGAVCAAYAVLSIRGLSSLPRIEIDNQGIREISHFGVTQSHQWTAITWFEPHVREHADGTDYFLGIKISRAGPSDEAEHSDLNLNCYLSKNIHRDQATTWIADWLDEFRQQTLSRGDAIQQLRHPKYLKGLFA